MARKKIDPVIPVVAFFETASLDAAKVALDIVAEIVRRRTPKPAPPPAQPGSSRPRAARKNPAAQTAGGPGTQSEIGG